MNQWQMSQMGQKADIEARQSDYLRIPVREQVEVAALMGDVAEDPSGRPSLHVHLVVGKRTGEALAGHLAEGQFDLPLEVIVTESPTYLRKVKDKESGLPLIRL